MARLLGGLAAASVIGVTVAAQGPPPVTVPAAAQRFIDEARAVAGEDWRNLADSVCNSAVALGRPPAARGGGAPAAATPAPPARDTWYAEPQRVFDNLYYVGMRDFSAWAITTSQGIILLDAIFDYSIEAEVDEGLRKLGFNPADIKYVVVSHGHVDHAGGAKFLQEKYGARLVMGAADYDLLDRQNPSWKPKRDLVASDGMPLTLGDFTMTLYLTPGHTEGTISTIFPVRDGPRRHLVATWGGTSFNFGPIRARIDSYGRQAERFGTLALAAGADVILSNHPGNDGTHRRIAALKTRTPAAPHPFVSGTAAVSRYFMTAGQCARAGLEIVPA